MLKRAIDFIVALVALLVLFLPLLIVWSLVRLTSKGPGLFWSERVGRNGKVFKMPKFRTMTTCSKVVSREVAAPTDVTFTSIGPFLRKTSIDELPQLYSVLIGDMSFIGPRPVLPNDEAVYHRSSCKNTLLIRPGITGLAQVNGRNNVTPQRKARYDAFYARKMCLVLDTKILTKTVMILHRTDFVK